MTKQSINIYKAARNRARLTLETASEMLNVAPRSLAHYEAGDRPTPDEVVASMMQAYNAPYLGYQHLRASPVGKVILPEVCDISPARCAIKAALAAEQMPSLARKMMVIGEDNRIDRSELETLAQIQSRARMLVGAFFSILVLSGEKEKAPGGNRVLQKDECKYCRDSLHI